MRRSRESEVAGARFAVERVNQSGGILGRQVELLVADSANDIAAGVHKTRELIDRRPSRFHHRQRQLGGGARDDAGDRGKAQASYRDGRSYRRDHRRPLQLERVPDLQDDEHGGQCDRRYADPEVRQQMVLSHARLCLWSRPAGRIRAQAARPWRHLDGKHSAARHRRLFRARSTTPGASGRRFSSI